MSETQFNYGDTIDRDSVLEEFPEPDRLTKEVTGHLDRHTDAASMRRHFGVPKWDREQWDWPIIPDLLVHTWDAGPDTNAGGTDLLGSGKPGSGKSTLLCHLSKTVLEANEDEPVTWRGATSRSEWLPLHRLTRLCLPRSASIRVELVPRDPSRTAIELEIADLERIVREVVYYEDPHDLNQNLIEPGQFHVIYPDPTLSGCQAIYRDSSKTIEPPSGRDDLFNPEDPPDHFWFAYLLDRVENGPFYFQTQVLDEIGDIAPQSARSDKYASFQKVELLNEVWRDARKNGLTIFAFGHSEGDIHQLIRNKIRWRITMNGAANPTGSSAPVGFDTVPMNHEMTSRMNLGEGLVFTEQNFESIRWPDYPSPTTYKLKIHLGGGL